MNTVIALFRKPSHLRQFSPCINKQHSNIKFSVEAEEAGAISLLNFKIYRENEKFASSIYRKAIYTKS